MLSFSDSQVIGHAPQKFKWYMLKGYFTLKFCH